MNKKLVALLPVIVLPFIGCKNVIAVNEPTTVVLSSGEQMKVNAGSINYDIDKNKESYVSLNANQVIGFHKDRLSKLRTYFQDLGVPVYDIANNKINAVEGIYKLEWSDKDKESENFIYTNKNTGRLSYVDYSSKVTEKDCYTTCEFGYLVDNDTNNFNIRNLPLEKCYSIMTGTDLDSDLLNDLNSSIKSLLKNNKGVSPVVTIKEELNFGVYMRLNNNEIQFKITSGGNPYYWVR